MRFLLDRLAPLATDVALNRRRPLLVAMLTLLYLILLLGVGSRVGKMLFIAHLGLFMLWQPFVRTDRRIPIPVLAAIFVAIVVLAKGLGGWLLVFWIGLLAGVVGGKMLLFEARWARLFFLLALFWLSAALLLVAVPAALPPPHGGEVIPRELAWWGLPAALTMMMALPEAREVDRRSEVVDYVYSVIVVLLLAVLVLGSLALMLLLGHSYGEALLESLLAIGLMLLALGWAWNPRLGMAGMGTIFSRYLMSIGMPVEQWLHTLTDLAERRQEPDDFVDAACREMVARLPWVAGVSWHVGAREGAFGSLRGRRSDFDFDGLVLHMYTRYPLSPSLAWHFSLLARLIAEFRADKLRERQLKRLSYIEAVHETGARVTHDIKNLLQALHGLCAVAEKELDQASPEFIALLRRQLPAIAGRLEQTLGKLSAPRIEVGEQIPLGRWWGELCARHALAGIGFSVEGQVDESVLVPGALLNSAVDNLIANVLDKRRTSPGLRIDVILRPSAGGASVDVCDDGAAISAVMASSLFHGPVVSETGLGIGLYQLARSLHGSGFEVRLATNEPGRVCFRLCPPC